MAEILKFEDQEAWFAARVKRPSASCFDKILTPGKLARSGQWDGYLNKLLAERVTGTPDEELKLDYVKAIRQGHEREPDAITEYVFATGSEVDEGFVIAISDDGRYTCSPDALVAGQPGGLEAKSPNRGTHIGYLREGKLPAKYRLQVAGSLLVTKYDWWDFISYHPDMRALIVRTFAADVAEEMRALRPALDEFCDELDRAEEEYRARFGGAATVSSQPLPAAEPAPSCAGCFGG